MAYKKVSGKNFSCTILFTNLKIIMLMTANKGTNIIRMPLSWSCSAYPCRYTSLPYCLLPQLLCRLSVLSPPLRPLLPLYYQAAIFALQKPRCYALRFSLQPPRFAVVANLSASLDHADSHGKKDYFFK